MKKVICYGKAIARKEMKLITGGKVAENNCVGTGNYTNSVQCPNGGPTVCCNGIAGGPSGESGAGCLQGFIGSAPIYFIAACPVEA
jgi:hypothetical protein